MGSMRVSRDVHVSCDICVNSDVDVSADHGDARLSAASDWRPREPHSGRDRAAGSDRIRAGARDRCAGRG